MQGNPAPDADGWHCEGILVQKKGKKETPDPHIMPSNGREFRNSSPAATRGFGKTSACKT
jgi:hypothetical protein